MNPRPDPKARLIRVSTCLFVCFLLTACGPSRRALPPAPPPVAGYWFDTFREARQRAGLRDLIAGSAKVKITPPPGERIAGHGFNRRSKGILDDLYARVLYLDSGPDAVVLVSLDLIGISLPRVERIRQRISRRFQNRIIIAATHNHFGPDTLGFWGPAVLRLLPVRSGIDPRYMEWLETRVVAAVQRAVATARPARMFLGRLPAPGGFVQNVREPEDLPRTIRVLRLAGVDGFTIATLVNYGCHAETLQDRNHWISADFPGVLCREVDAALGGTCLFFSGPAGGMIEPANDPRDPEPSRLAFLARFGGSLARGVIAQAISGMVEVPRPQIQVRVHRFSVPVQPDGLLNLAMKLDLLEPRPLSGGRMETEMVLVRLGPLSMLTVPGEPTPEVGRALRVLLPSDYKILLTLAQDELAYILSERQWDLPQFDYERAMSVGPGLLPAVLRSARVLVSEIGAGGHQDQSSAR